MSFVGNLFRQHIGADYALRNEFGDSVAQLGVSGFDGRRIAQYLNHSDFERREAHLSSFERTEPKPHSRHWLRNLSGYGDFDDARHLSCQSEQMCGSDTCRTRAGTGDSKRGFEHRWASHAEAGWLAAVVDPAANPEEIPAETQPAERRLDGTVRTFEVLATEERSWWRSEGAPTNLRGRRQWLLTHASKHYR